MRAAAPIRMFQGLCGRGEERPLPGRRILTALVTPMSAQSISIKVRCYAELNDRLSPEWRQERFVFHCPHDSRVGDVLGALGIDPDIVDLALVNGISTGLSHILAEDDLLSLFPVFETFDIGSVTRVRDRALRRPSFVLDVHLGKLAHLLRMLGFDTLYRNTYTDEELVAIAAHDGRTLLSKDRALVADDAVQRGLVIRSQTPRVQLLEVLDWFDLYRESRPFTRCLECNDLLSPASERDVQAFLPPAVRGRYEEFNTCVHCGRVYWKGSHYRRMEEYVKEILSAGLR